MHLTIVGFGAGGGTLTEEARAALADAGFIAGAPRLLAQLPPETVRTAEFCPAYEADKILAAAKEAGAEQAAAVFSGDSGFYSGATALVRLLTSEGIPYRVLPGLSSAQLLAARLGRSWQDWMFVSAHGRAVSAVESLRPGRPTFFLTDKNSAPQALCAELSAAGFGGLPVTVGEELGLTAERVRSGTAAEFANETFSPLSVLLAEGLPRPEDSWGPFLPDEAFRRAEHTPMTKFAVRAAALSLLHPQAGETMWDVGAGTGSVSISLARCAGRVFAVEEKEEALGLLRKNREILAAWNLTVVPGRAPEALAGLPRPDAVFVGGADGALEAIVRCALAENPEVRLVIPSVTLETSAALPGLCKALGLACRGLQLGVSTLEQAGRYHLRRAQNPVELFLLEREA